MNNYWEELKSPYLQRTISLIHSIKPQWNRKICMYKISPRLIIICPDSHSHIWASGLNAGLKVQRERRSRVHLNLNLSLFIDFCSVNKSQRLRWVDGTLYVVLCAFISLVVLLGGPMIPTACVGFYSVIHTPPVWAILIISNCALIGRTPEL